MRFSCTKENFAQALTMLGGITGKNTNLPILNNVLIQADEQKVELVATNLEVAVTVLVRAKVDEAGSFTVPARTLIEYVSLLPNEKISLEKKDNEIVLSCGKSTTKIKGMPAEEFPIVPTADEGVGFVVKAGELSRALGQVYPAAAKNEIRPELSGVLFNFTPKELVLAATDSYRLAENKITIEKGGEEKRVIVPGRAAQELAHVLTAVEAAEGEAGVRVLVGENQIAASYGNARFTSRLIEGNYPDYTQIIPKEFKTTVQLDVAMFTKEIKAAGLFTTSGVNAVSLTLSPDEGSVGISSLSQQTGEHQAEVAAEVVGEKNTIVLNHRYLLDGLTNINTPEAVLKVFGAENPCVLSPKGNDGYLYIIMPIRQ